MARPEKKERNNEIYEKYLKGMSYGDIASIYSIDRAAIFRIVKRYKNLAVDNLVDETLSKE